jgi:hypothetical protein
MREKHPIDERFKALYEAEAVPPDHVRAALARRMGWDKAPKSGGGGLSVLPFAIVGVAGVVFALLTWSPAPENTAAASGGTAIVENNLGPTGPQGSTNTAAIVEALGRERPAGTGNAPGQDPARAVDAGNTGETAQAATTTPASARTGHIDRTSTGPAIASAPALGQVQDGGRSSQADAAMRATTRASAAASRSKTDAGAAAGITTATVQTNDPGTEPAGILTGSFVPANVPVLNTDRPITNEPLVTGDPIITSADPAAPGPMATSAGREAFGLDLLDPLWAAGAALDPRPQHAPRMEAYVLPAGYWWIGPYAGVSTVQGKWTGTDSHELDRAEHWRSSSHLGLMAGRGWRSGFSVGGGIGLTWVRSDLDHELRGASTEVTNVDTTWAEAIFPGTTQHVYTWFIDSTHQVIPGAATQVNARNQYTVLQVPVALWWHGQMRRWTFGGTAGVMGWIPMAREGTTLMRTADGLNTSTDLADAQVDRRFGMQVHGTAGASLGYMLTEHLTLFAEPLLSTPLYAGGDGPSLSLTRPTFQIRLQHELRSRR